MKQTYLTNYIIITLLIIILGIVISKNSEHYTSLPNCNCSNIECAEGCKIGATLSSGQNVTWPKSSVESSCPNCNIPNCSCKVDGESVTSNCLCSNIKCAQGGEISATIPEETFVPLEKADIGAGSSQIPDDFERESSTQNVTWPKSSVESSCPGCNIPDCG